MNTRLPVLLIPMDRRVEWEAILWDQGFEPVWTGGLPDPRTSPDEAQRRLFDLGAPFREPLIDSLTGLPQRRDALIRLEDEAGLVDPGPLWLALINVDNLKKINDNFGPEVGDLVLSETGRLIRTRFTSARVWGRIAGDGFLLALRGEAPAVREALVGLLLAVRNARFSEQFLLTVSIGLARYRPGEAVDEWMDRADRNLYGAKSHGRNQIVDEEDFTHLFAGTDLTPELADFENRVRVFTDRLISGASGRGRMVEASRDESDQDGLTGLFNRRYFDRRLAREVQRSRKLGSPLTIVVLDLDDLTAVNAQAGYPAGDEVLKAAAQVVLRGIRVVDWVGRYGGDRFCGVFPDTETQTASLIAERIRQALEDLEVETAQGTRIRITASLGVVTLGEGDAGVSDVLQRAEVAVRGSKISGKNRVTTQESGS